MTKFYKMVKGELLNQKVYKILKTRIIKGDIKSGSKLPEVEISKGLGISRTPVREAIQKLAGEGYVKKVANQGFVVTEVSSINYQEVSAVRGVLEGLTSYYFAKRSTSEKIEELQKIVDQMSQIFDSEDADQLVFSKLNEEFHNLILYGCENSYLIQILGNLYKQYYRFRARTFKFPNRLKTSLEEHKKILEAFKKKDVELAEKLSREHNSNALKAFLNSNKKMLMS